MSQCIKILMNLTGNGVRNFLEVASASCHDIKISFFVFFGETVIEKIWATSPKFNIALKNDGWKMTFPFGNQDFCYLFKDDILYFFS